MLPLHAVLLDVDGTLVDSNDAHASAWVDVLRDAGYGVAFDQVRRLIGKGGDKLLPEVTGLAKDSPEGKKISRRRAEVFRAKYLLNLRPFPRARDLLERMNRDGLRLVAATSAEEQEMNALLQITGGAEYFDRTTSSSDARHSKPDPDIVEAALRKARCRADEAVMLGDTPYDVEAAAAAGVPAVGLRSGGWSDVDLSGAIAIYDDPADLLAGYEASPFGRLRA
jgi:HAD superfamily hydrolase (TIGR01509 family)